MSSSTIGSHVSQAVDIGPHFYPQVVLQGHLSEYVVEREHGRLVQRSDPRMGKDAELGHDTFAHCWAETVEALESCRDLEMTLERDVEYERHLDKEHC